MTSKQPGRQAQDMTPKRKEEEGKMQQSDETEKIPRFVLSFLNNQCGPLPVPQLFLMEACVTQTQTVTE